MTSWMPTSKQCLKSKTRTKTCRLRVGLWVLFDSRIAHQSVVRPFNRSTTCIVLGVPVSSESELLDAISPQYIAALIYRVIIDACPMVSQLHCELALGVSFPMGSKNGTTVGDGMSQHFGRRIL